jgi:predicted amidohydrolase YtcJ
LAVPAASQPAPERHADLILTNGDVRTPSGWARAVAVRRGVIVAVGDEAAVGALKGPDTQVVELDGRAVFPGLHDLHVHAVRGGLEQATCGFRPAASPDEIAAAVTSCAAAKNPGDWISGGNWIAAVFAPGQQSKAFLDRIAPNNPTVLSDESHHAVWANSKALTLAGITRETADPVNGVIERDTSGEPTGILREAAVGLLLGLQPPPSEAELRGALILATNLMMSHGVTSFTDAGVDPEIIGAMADLSAEGVVKVRMRGCLSYGPPPEDQEAAARAFIAQRSFYARPRFRLDCVKMRLDGVPTEGHTGAMLHPYEGSTETGMLTVPQPLLDRIVTEFDRQGLHLKFHAAGDAAVRAAIEAVAAARKTNGAGGPMHDVAHNSFVDPADIGRVRDLNMSWEFSPYIWYPTPIAAQDVGSAVGEERMKRWIPIRDAVESGALVAAGSDWSVVPSINPWLAIETMVTRQMPGGSEETLGEDQRITLEQALHIFTEGGAREMGHRDIVGSIEPGMRADLVVTRTNPFKVPIDQVHRTEVDLTFIDGEQVYDAADPPNLTAH